jgi:predicted O-methyltransferase YrrM
MFLFKSKRKLKKLNKDIALIYMANQLNKKINNISSNNIEILIQELQNSKLFRLEQKTHEIKYVLELITKVKPSIICEIGAFRGGTLCAFSKVAPPYSTIISVDLNYPLSRKMAHKFFKHHQQKIICLQGNTQKDRIIAKMKRVLGNKQIDFLFIDGDHSLFGVMNDYVRFSPLVKKGGIIAFHDIFPDQHIRTGKKSNSNVGGVPFFWDAIKKSGAKVTEIIEDFDQDGYGIGILYK